MSNYKAKNPPAKKIRVYYDANGISNCLSWTIEDVEDWVEHELKLPQYKACFSTNFIDGKRLIKMEASNLPRIGITDFEHIKFVTSKIRDLLGIEYPDCKRPIHLPPKETLEHFYERKSHTGVRCNRLTYKDHVKYLEKFKKHGVPEC